jgi:hypothetical protein
VRLTMSLVTLSIFAAVIGVDLYGGADQRLMMKLDLTAATTAGAMAAAEVIDQSYPNYAPNSDAATENAVNAYVAQWQLQNVNGAYVTPGPVSITVTDDHVSATATVSFVPFMLLPLIAVFPGMNVQTETITQTGTARI